MLTYILVAIGSHHLEYGFPSTHSTNCVSIALFFYAIFHRFASAPSANDGPGALQHTTVIRNSLDVAQPAISPTLYIVLCSILVLYSVSIVFGRLYTGMHSFTDCVFGVMMGAGIWWVQTDWLGVPFVFHQLNLLYHPLNTLGLGNVDSYGELTLHLGRGLNTGAWADEWVQRGGWEIPLILIPLCLLAVHKHPQPVDDCPCFEDAIAILSVVLGAYLSHWAVNFSGALQRTRSVVMPGSGWVLEAGQWLQLERGWQDILLWWAVAAVKMILGLFCSYLTWQAFFKSYITAFCQVF